MAYNGENSNLISDEQMGVFSGYIRRPKPTQTGMIALVFGENGDDADTILALSLSKYQDIQVFVNIYLIKDPNGKIMKQGEEYPLICSFLGFVRRSLPQKDGMVAQFFSPNGEHADAVSLLSKSEYQDCLVFVDVRGSLAIKNTEVITQENMKDIEDKYVDKFTRYQKTENARKDKFFRKMNEYIQTSDFLYRIEVLTSLGKAEDYKEWLKETQLCAHHQDGSFCNKEVHVVTIDTHLFKPFNYLPVCDEHESRILDETHFTEHTLYYEMKHRFLVKEWAWHKMKEKFSYDGKSEPDPSKVIDWANSKNVLKFLPAKYQAVL